jgi:hypothetical protein
MIEAKAPLANEKALTPAIIRRIQVILSVQVLMLISPYPTVVIVVIVK